jgi:hypothetical protein
MRIFSTPGQPAILGSVNGAPKLAELGKEHQVTDPRRDDIASSRIRPRDCSGATSRIACSTEVQTVHCAIKNPPRARVTDYPNIERKGIVPVVDCGYRRNGARRLGRQLQQWSLALH